MNENVSRTLTPPPDSRLAQLNAEYESAKAAFESAKERFEGIKDSLKAEMRAAEPDATAITLEGRTPLRLARIGAWKIDSKRLKKERRSVWALYAKYSESWRLDEVKQ